MPFVSVNTATVPASAAIATNNITRDGGILEAMQMMNIADPITGTSANVTAAGALNVNVAAGTDNSISGTITVTDSSGVTAPANDGTVRTGTSTVNSYVVLPIAGGTSSWAAQILGLTSGTLYFELSMDSTTGIDGNWIAVNGRQAGVLNTVLTYAPTTNGVFRGNASDSKYLRIRAIGALTGTPTITLRASNGEGATFFNAGLPPSLDIIGKVGIDQTAPGTSNGVQIVAALPVGANSIGTVINGAGSANIGSIQLADGTTPTQKVAISTTGALSVSQTSTFGTVINLTALNSVAGPYTASGVGDWGVQLTTTNFIGTVSFQASIDGTNYVNVNARQVGLATNVDNLYTSWVATGTSTSVLFRGNAAPFKFLQFLVTAFTSGSVNAYVVLGGNVGGTFHLSSIPGGTANIGTLQIADGTTPAQKVAVSSAGALSANVVAGQPDTSISSTITVTDSSGVAAPANDGVLRTGTSTAGSYVSLALSSGTASWTVQIVNAFTGTLYFELSFDSTTGIDGNWIAANSRQSGILNTAIFYSSTTAGVFRGNSSGAKYIRVRAVGALTGTPAIVLRSSVAEGATFFNTGLPPSSNLIGKTGIDQTTPGATNGVQLLVTGAATTTPLYVRSVNDATNTSAVAGTALAVVKASAGRLVSVLITSVGTVAVPIYDNASAASGTIIGAIPASPTLYAVYVFAAPAASGITVSGVAGGSAFTVMYA